MAREDSTQESVLDRRSYLKLAGTAAATIATPTAVTSSATAHEQTTEDTDCFDSGIHRSREQQRVDMSLTTDDPPVADQILAQSNFETLVTAFKTALCDVSSVEEAHTLVAEHGTRLWKVAVARAQGHQPTILESGSDATSHQYDDRPLYWARLQMAILLRRWTPSFELGESVRQALLTRLEYTSRGITSTRFLADSDTNILVTGFDPFALDAEPRNSNPSGMAALQLDGRRLETDQGHATVQTVIFPVRWQAFDDGIVEDAIGPHLQADSPTLDAIVTCSRGSSKNMRVEQWAGAWRDGGPGAANNRERRNGPIPPAVNWPQPATHPDWIETTLPVTAMVAAETGSTTTVAGTNVVEWPAPHSNPDPRKSPIKRDQLEARPNGPTTHSRAFSGSGGNFMSNESMYRANRLRRAMGHDDLPGGHLHTPIVRFPKKTKTEITDSTWEATLKTTTDQVVALVSTLADAIETGDNAWSHASDSTRSATTP